MEPSDEAGLAGRVAALEARVAALEGHGDHGDRSAPPGEAPGPAADAETFWALAGLKERVLEPGAVLFTGAVDLPSGEHYEWQEGRLAADLLGTDWTRAADALGAIAHPVRLLLLREIVHGARTTAELRDNEALGTTGQLYHHLRRLAAAGWLRATARGEYAVPGDRVVPLLAILAAIRT